MGPNNIEHVPHRLLVCAWCLKVMRQGIEPARHGICEMCLAEDRRRRLLAIDEYNTTAPPPLPAPSQAL